MSELPQGKLRTKLKSQLDVIRSKMSQIQTGAQQQAADTTTRLAKPTPISSSVSSPPFNKDSKLSNAKAKAVSPEIKPARAKDTEELKQGDFDSHLCDQVDKLLHPSEETLSPKEYTRTLETRGRKHTSKKKKGRPEKEGMSSTLRSRTETPNKSLQ
mmetsp:Transcript_37178/g.57073  ORF Transcript_37178/g.57073 Transcript_37178/m.57073 type:complete len:157 (-) Transcript_37178:4872-5342(-)